MIVKHRRGTTQEWHELNLHVIPEAGELIIEECVDGTRRCKIGTGFTRFSELSYIDDKTRADLLLEIAAAKAYLKNRIDNLNESLLEELSKIESELMAINVKCSELENDYITRDAKLRADTAKNLTEAVTLLKNDIASVTEQVAASQASLKATLKADLTKAITDTTTAFNADIEAEKLAREVADEAIRDSVEAVEVSIINKIQPALYQLEAQLNSVETDFNNKLSDTDNRITSEVSQLNEQLDELSTTVNTEIAAQISELDDKVNNTIVSEISRIESELESSTSTLDSKISEHATNVANSITEVVSQTDEKITQLGTDLTTEIDSLDSRVVALEEAMPDGEAIIKSIADLKTSTNLEFIEVHNDIEAVDTIVQELTSVTDTKFTEVEGVIAENKTSTDVAIEALAEQIDITNTRIDETNAEVFVQSKRIDNIIALPEGSTAADAELFDIRVGYNGIDHESAGSAVRAIGSDLEELRASLSQYIDTQAIDGLYYDYSGEVGLKQPYMLYLTANKEVLEDSGVQIISGGGGGGSSTTSSLKLGYITTSPVIATTSDKVVLKYTFSGTDSSGDEILQAAATWKVNGTVVEYTTINAGENEFDVTKYLLAGTTKVLLTVTDDNGSVVTKTWSVQQIELSVSSSFDDKSTYPVGEDIIFTYTPTGAVNKTVIFKLDGEEIIRKELTSNISGVEIKQLLPAQMHGAHLLDVYLEAEINGETVKSSHLLKDLLWYDSSSKTPLIGTAIRTFEVKQYSTTNIIYTVYDPTTETPTVSIEVDGVVVSTPTIGINPDYNNTPTAIYSYTATETGVHTIKLICGTVEKVITVLVEKLDIEISPVTAGLVFDFNPIGKTNGDSQRLWSYNNVHMSVSDNFDWTNGGYIPDDPDGPCFCIKAGSTATIDYKLFADEATKLGKEFKLVFKTKNVSNPDAVFLSCVDNTTDKDHIGINMGVQGAKIYGQSGNLELVYSEDDIIEFEFNISKDTELVPMLMGYEDGVPSRPLVYDDTYSFKQADAKEISLGSPDCDLYIYRFKVYNTSLTASEVLNNFIADARTTDEMISRYNRNQIYDENHKLTPEVLAQKCPWLRVYKVSAPHFTNNKSDKVPDTTIQQLYKNGDPILDNWTCYNAQHSGQGTSSNNYGAAGRNLDFIMNKSSSYFELGDGTVTKEITLTRDSVPVAYLNAKVNIASSNNLTNAILANRYNRFNPYERPFVRPEGYPIDNIKDTMEFHNCVIFIQETDPDLSTHREFADKDWHFYAIGNIGDSKKTDNTRLTDPDDKYECCVELMDVKLPLSDFPVDTMMNAMSYTVDETTKEKVYTWAKDENLGILYEKQGDGSYVLTSDTTVDLSKTYYVDILEHDDFSEDYTYGWRYISDDEDPDVVSFCKQKWIELYRFITTSSNEEFKANLKNYFVVDSALYYYLFTTRYCMVDNRAKNTFWHYGKTADGTRKWDLCWDYDNDTSLGLNNYGKQVYRYGLEDIDRDAAGEEVFREMDSTFFCRIRDLFATELKTMYNSLESKNAWHSESFINECDKWQDEFPEELWRIDIDRKYIRTYTSSFINGKGDAQFLVNMCNGKMKYHRRQWERNQDQYMASKYQTVRASGDNYHANFRFGGPSTENPVVPANYQLTLTPYSYIYLNVQYGDTAPYTVRITDAEINKPTVVPFYGTSADIVNVYSASAIRDFGDLSACYPKTVSIGNASRVKTLTLGNTTEGYDNAVFTTLTTDANPLLEELNITNISSLTQTLNFSKLVNLKTLKAFGTSTPSVIFADGGKLSYAELPAVNNITLKNLSYITSDNFKLSSYDNVLTLVVDGCPLIDKVDLLNKCNNLKKVRLINVNFGAVTYDYFETKVFNLKGIALNGDETPNAWITGSAEFESLTGEQYNELKMRYPYLDIKFDTLVSDVIFMSTDGESELYRETVTSYNSTASDCADPILTDKITEPTKASTAEFDYVWNGWTTTLDGEIASDALVAILGNRILYPTFEAIRRSYTVTFINPTAPAGNQVLAQVSTFYGNDVTYTGIEPQKLDTATPSLYYFLGWSPAPTNITGDLECFAQFAILDSVWYTINLPDITDCPDYSGNLISGYTLNTSKGTMAITACKNKLNKAVKIPEQFDISGTSYTVTTVGGFRDHDNIELLNLPATLNEISSHSFYSCNYLNELAIPENVTRIGTSAFQGCTSLDEVVIPKNVSSIGNAAFAECTGLTKFLVDSNNQYYVTLQNGQLLLEVATGKLLQGLSGSAVTSVMGDKIHSLGDYCFAYTTITRIGIPEGITSIPTNAFSHCEQLTDLTLPSTLAKLDATCFAWCYKLASVELNQGLLDIGTYVFNSCALENIEIPNTVRTVQAQSFGNMPTLKSVTFNARINADGTVFVPDISKIAFSGAGTKTNPVVFNLPWTEEQHNVQFTGTDTDGAAKHPGFGASYYTLNFI